MACCSRDKELPLDASTRILPPTSEGNEKKNQETPYIVFGYGLAPPEIHQKRLSAGLCKSGIEKIACGSSHFLMLTENNVLLVAGNNLYGQCARDPSQNDNSPLKVAQIRMEKHLITDVAAGSYHSLLISKTEGLNRLMAFGHELGCGFLDRKHRWSPTSIISNELPDNDPPVKVFAGRMRSAVILRSGKVKMWGEWYNGAKQRALKQVDIRYDIQGDGVSKVAMGQFHALFLTKAGGVYSWGDNTYGELGVGKSVKWRTVPEPVAYFQGMNCVDCDVGGRHSLVLVLNESKEEIGQKVVKETALYSFGDNSEGQCGIELSRAYEPTLIETKGMLGDETVHPVSIFTGDAHSALVTNEGDLFAWGDNSEQRLGIRTTSSIFRPTLVEDVMGRNLCAVGLGGFFSVLVTGPREYSIGRKDMTEQKTRKIFKDMIFSQFKSKPEAGAKGDSKPKGLGFAGLLKGGLKPAEERKEEDTNEDEKRG